MADTPSAPSPLAFIETGPDGGWCDVETGTCTISAADQEGPHSESQTTAGDS